MPAICKQISQTMPKCGDETAPGAWNPTLGLYYKHIKTVVS
jgi:hypothetical protein